ncbi:MAG: hypothetical protein WKF97_02600 [Chitinophagaceae bacterium]
MKRLIPAVLTVLLITTSGQDIQAQLDLVADQNPQYTVSRDKYIKLADSINTWHSTTEHQTYKAIDYLEDKRELRKSRQALHQELRLERARYGWSYDYNQFSPAPFSYYNRNNYNRNRFCGYRYRTGNYLWSSIPLAFALGLWCR